MFQSETEICNAALMLLGDKPLNSLDDLTDRARLCKQIWPMVLDDEIAAHRWKATLRRAELTRKAAAPAWGWSYQYALPTDPICLSVIEMKDPKEEYEIEGDVLLCNNTTALIRYKTRIAAGAAGPGMQSALVARMMAELAMPITKKEAVVKAAWAAYHAKISSALAADGQQGVGEVLEDTTLIDARR